jgi:hypothetical protein
MFRSVGIVLWGVLGLVASLNGCGGEDDSGSTGGAAGTGGGSTGTAGSSAGTAGGSTGVTGGSAGTAGGGAGTAGGSAGTGGRGAGMDGAAMDTGQPACPGNLNMMACTTENESCMGCRSAGGYRTCTCTAGVWNCVNSDEANADLGCPERAEGGGTFEGGRGG